MILRDLVNYKENIINLKIGLIIIKIKGIEVTINFNILLLGNDEVVLGMP